MSVVDIHLQKLLWVYCPGGLKRNDGAGRLAGKATLAIGLLLGIIFGRTFFCRVNFLC